MSSASQVAVSLIACIVGAGVLGGLIGWLGEDPPKPPSGNGSLQQKNKGISGSSAGAAAESGNPKPFFYYLLLSTGAAATVPLFLTLVQSKICDSIFSINGDFKLQDWFVFFGLCVLAAIFAKKYLDTLYDKFLEKLDKTNAKLTKTAETADQTKDRLDERIENERDGRQATKQRFHLGSATLGIQPENFTVESTDDTGAERAPEPPTPPADLSDAEKDVFAALHNPAFALGRRSLGGIVTETGLDQEAAQATLNKLKAKHLIEEIRGQQTRNLYYRWRRNPSG